MRTVGGLHEKMLAHENLLEAVHRAALGRRGQPAVQAYLARLEEQMDALRDELAIAQPRSGECHTFTIHDPKRRVITAPVFRERVLHHAVMNVCGPVLDRRLIHHSYACRTGKGTFAALTAARAGACGSPWFLKLDVRKYFESIPHGRLLAALGRVFRERAVLDIFATLVSAYCPGSGRGLAIGTLVSQHLANFYLASLDTFIVQDIRPSGYVRYMDDMALWQATKSEARGARARIVEFARTRLGLEFKTMFINATARGMDFLGHRVFPRRIGLNRASRRRFRAKLAVVHRDWVSGACEEAAAQARATALAAFSSHARCVKWRRRVVRDLGDGPQAVSACCAAAAGSTTAGTPDPPTATGTRRTTPTTTSACVPVPAPAEARSALVEQARPPVPRSGAADETESSRRWPVALRCRSASGEDERRGRQVSILP